MRHLSVITDEEKEILSGRKKIDRDIYMAGDRDIISGDKLLPHGKNIMIRPHTRFIHRTTSLNEIADILHYNHTTLSRLVKQKTDRNFTALLQEKRLSKAA